MMSWAKIAADQLLIGREDVLQLGILQPLGDARRQPLAGGEPDLAGVGIDQIAGELALVLLRVERRHPALGAAAEGDPCRRRRRGSPPSTCRSPRPAAAPCLRSAARFAAVGGIVERQEQRRRRQLAAPVDADIDVVLGVELEIEPGAAIGDDPGGEQILARGMRLALVVVEEHAGAAVHLGDDDPLGAVDDERAVARHQRHVAHIDVLLLDVADRARAGVLVDIPHDEPQRDLQRRGEGDAALLAFVDVVFRGLQLVADEFELGPLGEIADREDRLEDLLQPDTDALLGQHAHLQEVIVRAPLNLDQVGHRRDFGDAPESLADPLLAVEGNRHLYPSLWAALAHPGRGPDP